MSLPVLTKTLRDHRGGILGWSGALVLLAVMMLSVFPTVHGQARELEQFLKNYPEALRAVFGIGENYTTGPGYLDVELFSFLAPLIALAAGIGFGAGATAAEEERGTIDWLLSAPVSRSRVLMGKTSGVLLAVLAAGAVLAVTLLIGSSAAGLGVSAAGILAACMNLVLLGWAFAAVALAVGAATGRRWVATGTGVALALGAFLLTSLARIVPALEGWQWLSPFTWYASGDALQGHLHAGYVAALAVTTVVALGLALAAFRHRDLGL